MESREDGEDMLGDFSLVTPFGYQSGSCGYCKNPTSSGSYYASSTFMTADHYQLLIDRSWRRSGTLLYKPDQIRSCCPHYTIRLPVSEFRASRDQRQALHRWNKFVLGDHYIAEAARLYPKSKEEKKRQQNNFDLHTTVHEAEFTNLKRPPEPEHRFEVSLESNAFTEEKYELFEQYQRLVHREESSSISKGGFKRFLCETPLPATTSQSCGKSQRLGSYHHCYRLDGKLIAMGVLDLLPRAVSSVYLIYDVEYEKYGFGKLSALRETLLAQEGGYRYYYMGFYIHSCKKMRYKNDYKPQFILDPDTNSWDRLDEAYLSKLDQKGFVSLSRERQSSALSPDTAAATPPLHLKDPRAAQNSKLSVMELDLPGVMSLRDLDEKIDLASVIMQVGSKGDTQLAPAGALVGWEKGSLTDARSIKRLVGELLACVGPDVAQGLIIDLAL